ncbi:hypothetical protein N665_1048s0004 [Sinapis alba]|nr:hypothetical protein N665_1048s0004 [Sinapis alba]
MDFLKNKLDEFKKSYNMWKFLMKSTGISVDPETSMIYASPEWWDNHEVGYRITKSFNREPPKFWNVMVQCFGLHDTEENEEIYRVNVDDNERPSNEFTYETAGINIGRGGRHGSSSHSSGRRGSSLHRSGGSS